MKSILNDVHRLEKAFEIFERLIVVCNEITVYPLGNAAQVRFEDLLRTANAFIEKYGNDK